MNKSAAMLSLVALLRSAYAGELAAAHAYRGHRRSLRNAGERAAIRRIESEEWAHRVLVGEMLAAFEVRPSALRDAFMHLVGSSIGLSCFVGGRFIPMYFAGRLESSNVLEYEAAVAYARELGLSEFESRLAKLADVEREHEAFFLEAVAGHRLLPVFRRTFGWGNPKPTPRLAPGAG
jgi:demethoxyubiquinone hydroxylase (CLK1/Coq7/Cat5 family)